MNLSVCAVADASACLAQAVSISSLSKTFARVKKSAVALFQKSDGSRSQSK